MNIIQIISLAMIIIIFFSLFCYKGSVIKEGFIDWTPSILGADCPNRIPGNDGVVRITDVEGGQQYHLYEDDETRTNHLRQIKEKAMEKCHEQGPECTGIISNGEDGVANVDDDRRCYHSGPDNCMPRPDLEWFLCNSKFENIDGTGTKNTVAYEKLISGDPIDSQDGMGGLPMVGEPTDPMDGLPMVGDTTDPIVGSNDMNDRHIRLLKIENEIRNFKDNCCSIPSKETAPHTEITLPTNYIPPTKTTMDSLGTTWSWKIT